MNQTDHLGVAKRLLGYETSRVRVIGASLIITCHPPGAPEQAVELFLFPLWEMIEDGLVVASDQMLFDLSEEQQDLYRSRGEEYLSGTQSVVGHQIADVQVEPVTGELSLYFSCNSVIRSTQPEPIDDDDDETQCDSEAAYNRMYPLRWSLKDTPSRLNYFAYSNRLKITSF